MAGLMTPNSSGGRLDHLAIRDANLAGLRQRGTVAVDFRIAADFDELRRFPIVHMITDPVRILYAMRLSS